MLSCSSLRLYWFIISSFSFLQMLLSLVVWDPSLFSSLCVCMIFVLLIRYLIGKNPVSAIRMLFGVVTGRACAFISSLNFLQPSLLFSVQLSRNCGLRGGLMLMVSIMVLWSDSFSLLLWTHRFRQLSSFSCFSVSLGLLLCSQLPISRSVCSCLLWSRILCQLPWMLA